MANSLTRSRVLGGLAIVTMLLGDFLATATCSPSWFGWTTTTTILLLVLPTSCEGFSPNMLPPIRPARRRASLDAEKKGSSNISAGGGGGSGSSSSMMGSMMNNAATTATLTSLAKYLFREVTEDINELTGNERWQPGDLLHWMNKNQYKYQFGDLTKWATGFAKEQAVELTGTDNVANLGVTFVEKVKSGQYKTDDIYLALKVLLTTGNSLGLTKNIPIRYLLELIDLGITKDDHDDDDNGNGDHGLMTTLSQTLEGRIQTALTAADTGPSATAAGGVSKEQMTSLVQEFTGKDHYSVGDIAKVILAQAKEKNSTPRTLPLNKIVDGIEEWDAQHTRDATAQ